MIHGKSKTEIMHDMAYDLTRTMLPNLYHEFTCPFCGRTALATKSRNGKVSIHCKHISAKAGIK